jgi:Mrp family chromosome partitioning ATPase
MEEGRKESLRPRLTELSKQLKAYRDTLNGLDQRELELRGLMREAKVKQEALDLYLKKEEESRINEILDQKGISNVTAIERAAVPEKPIRPRKALNFLVGLLAGLLGGFGSAYISEYLRQSFTTREETQRALKRSVIAALPFVRPGTSEAQRFSVELRHAAQRIFRTYHEQGLRTILVTSTLPGEGRSHVAAAIARALNELKFRVLLIRVEDFEQQAPVASNHLSSRIGGPQGFGHDTEVTPEPTDRQHLYHLRLQNHGRTALDFAERLTEVTKSMRDRFDLIVLDAPPLPLFPEMRVVVAAIDGTLLVIEAERTFHAAAARTIEVIEEAGGHLLGTVLNKCRYVIPSKVYDRFVGSGRGSGCE